jgi:hypothetical protein
MPRSDDQEGEQWNTVNEETKRKEQKNETEKKGKNETEKRNAPVGDRTRVCTVAGYYSTTRPLVLCLINWTSKFYLFILPT